MAASRKTIILRCVAAAVGIPLAALISGGVVGYLEASGAVAEGSGLHLWVMAPLAVFLMAGAIWVGAIWMKSIDEAAREAHKAAWYWGGSSGMALGGILMILSVVPGAGSVSIPTLLPDHASPAAYAASGAFGLMLLMVIGYTIVWAWWWLARR